MTGGKTLNLILKMLELFLKIQENIRISILKRRLGNLYKKENFRPEIKLMIENLQDELSRLVKKQAKSAKLLADIRWKLEGKKCSKTFFKLKDRIKQCLTYTYWWYKSKYSSSPKDIIKSEKKKFIKNSRPRRQFPKLQLLNFLTDFLTERKYLMKAWTLATQKHL